MGGRGRLVAASGWRSRPRAVQVSLFEVPVVRCASGGGDPREELGRQLEAGFQISRYTGVAVGARVFLAV